MYASLLISLFTAFFAMLAKQWSNRHLLHLGCSLVERCGDRQRKCDGLEKQSLHLLAANNLLVLLQASLLLVGGFCRYTWPINAWVAFTIATLIVPGVGFYVVTLISGTLPYSSPFQTPVSVILRCSCEWVWHWVTFAIPHFKQTFSWTQFTSAKSPHRQSRSRTYRLSSINHG